MNNKLQSEFIPYEESKELKALGFDEPCLMCHRGEYDLYSHLMGGYAHEMTLKSNTDLNGYLVNKEKEHWVSAPTWKQAFKFFRDKYMLHGTILPFTLDFSNNSMEYGYDIRGKKHTSVQIGDYEEAELACLKKLIELSKSICPTCNNTGEVDSKELNLKGQCGHCS